MEIKITVNVGPESLYKATFHPAPQRDSERERDVKEVPASPVRAGTSQVAPGLTISLPAAAASVLA